MKVKRLVTALDIMKGVVTSDIDAVELDHTWLRSTDGVWWAGAKMSVDWGYMILPYTKLAKIVKTLDPEAEISLEQRNTDCVVKSGGTVWKLNLKEVEFQPKPEMESSIGTLSGYKVNEAIRCLRHLMRTDLARPGLLLAWLSGDEDMVVGDGSRLGGKQVGAVDMEFPVTMIIELGRMLGGTMSETIEVAENEEVLGVELETYYFCVSKMMDHFEVEWFDRVRRQIERDQIEIQLSRSEMLSAIDRTMVTAGDAALVKFTVKGGYMVLESRDTTNQKCVTRVEAEASEQLNSPVVVDINHIKQAVEARTNELLSLKITDAVIGVEDESGWEVLLRKQETL